RVPAPLYAGRRGHAGAPAARLPRRFRLHRRPAQPQLRGLARARRRHRDRPAPAPGAGEGPEGPVALRGLSLRRGGPGVLSMADPRYLRWLPWALAAALVVLLAGTASGPWRAIEGIRQAVKTEDARALARQVDFPALRA